MGCVNADEPTVKRGEWGIASEFTDEISNIQDTDTTEVADDGWNDVKC